MALTSFGFGQTHIIQSEAAYTLVEDWSRCRSPSRAMRRRKLGHKQHVFMRQQPQMYRMGDKIVMHPLLYHKLSGQIARGEI
jgi:hypothetical protein